MKALAKQHAEPGIWMIDAPMPTYEADEVLIKIKKTAICGTDLHIYKWDEWAQRTVPVPLITGHEFVGEITAIGSNVRGLAPGDLVSGEGHLTCGICRNCRAGKRHFCREVEGIGYDCTGCFSEYFVMTATNVFKLPANFPLALGSILDPFGNATYTTLAFNLVGEDVLITGAGPIGMMAVAIARHVGARHIVITDVNPYRLALAKSMGATVAVNTQTTSLIQVMEDLGMKEGFDVGLEMSGHPHAFNEMIGAMNYGGKIALLGILPEGSGIAWRDVIFKGLEIKGIYGREMFETWYKMVSMLQSGLEISPVITHEFFIDDYQAAFEMAMSGQSAKVILNWEK